MFRPNLKESHNFTLVAQSNKLEVLNNTVILLDNQSDQDHTIKVAYDVYDLETKKCVQMKVSAEKTPAIIIIKCDVQKTSRRIILK